MEIMVVDYRDKDRRSLETLYFARECSQSTWEDCGGCRSQSGDWEAHVTILTTSRGQEIFLGDIPPDDFIARELGYLEYSQDLEFLAGLGSALYGS